MAGLQPGLDVARDAAQPRRDRRPGRSGWPGSPRAAGLSRGAADGPTGPGTGHPGRRPGGGGRADAGRRPRLLVACSGGAGLARPGRRPPPTSPAPPALPCAAVVVDHGLQPGSDAVAARGRGGARTGSGCRRRRRWCGVESAAPAPGRRPPPGTPATPRCAAAAAGRRRAGDGAARATPATTRPRPCCWGWPAARGPGRWPGWPSACRRPAPPAARTLPRATTEQACAELGLQPWSDPHNADPRFARVRVRRPGAARRWRQALGPGRRRRPWPGPPGWPATTPTCSTGWRPRPTPATRRPGLRRAGRAARRAADAGCCGAGWRGARRRRARRPTTCGRSRPWSWPGAGSAGWTSPGGHGDPSGRTGCCGRLSRRG